MFLGSIILHKYNNSVDAGYNSTNFVRGPFEDIKLGRCSPSAGRLGEGLRRVQPMRRGGLFVLRRGLSCPEF